MARILGRTTAFPTKPLPWRKQFFRLSLPLLLCQIRSLPEGKALITVPQWAAGSHLYPPLLVLRTGFKLLFMEMYQKEHWARGQETRVPALGLEVDCSPDL